MKPRSVILAGVASDDHRCRASYPCGAQWKAGERSESAAVEPQLAVVCTGWHALCSFTTDCQTNGGDKADCACWRVNETHIVVTDSIQDTAVKRMTQTRCTTRNACDVDEAPVCSAIRDGNTRWIRSSTTGCRRSRTVAGANSIDRKLCDPTLPNYVGDTRWAVCDAAHARRSRIPPTPRDP